MANGEEGVVCTLLKRYVDVIALAVAVFVEVPTSREEWQRLYI